MSLIVLRTNLGYTHKKIKQATSDEIIQNLIYCLSAKKGMSAAAEW